MNSLSFKTRFGWISAFEEKGKIVRIKFGKHRNKGVNRNLKTLKNKIPLAIPWHRVIRSDGTMGGFSSSGGIILKKKLLNFENSWKQ